MLRMARFFIWLDLSSCLDKGHVAQKSFIQGKLEVQRKFIQAGIERATGAAYNDERRGTFSLLISVETDTLLRPLCGEYLSTEEAG